MVSPSRCPRQGPGCPCPGIGHAGCRVRGWQLPSSMGTPRQGRGQGLPDPPPSPRDPQAVPCATPSSVGTGHTPALGALSVSAAPFLIAPPAPSPRLAGQTLQPPRLSLWDPQPRSLAELPPAGILQTGLSCVPGLLPGTGARGLARHWTPQGTPRRHRGWELLRYPGPWGQGQELGWDPAQRLLALGLGWKRAVLGCTGLEMGWAGLEMGWAGLKLGWAGTGLSWALLSRAGLYWAILG